MSRVFIAGSPVVLRRKFSRLTLAVAMALVAGTVGAQQVPTDHVPPPQDTPYAGTVTLHVDANDTVQGIFRVHETIPVKAGALTLLYPQWIPGDHSPTGPIAMLAGLKLSANGKPLAWKRDEYNVYAFHVDVPRGRLQRSTSTSSTCPAAPTSEGFEITDRMMDHGMEQGGAVSGRLFLARHHLRAERDAAARLAARHRAGDGFAVRRHHHLQAGDARTTWSIRRFTRASISSASISIRAARRRCTWTSSPMRRSIWR